MARPKSSGEAYRPVYAQGTPNEDFLRCERVLVDTPEKVDELLAAWDATPKCQIVGFDTETTALSPEDAELVGCSLAFDFGRGYYLPFGHRIGTNLPISEFERIGRVLYEANRVAYYNARFDLRIQRKYGHDIDRINFLDVSLLIWNWDTNRLTPKLKDLGREILGWDLPSYEKVRGKRADLSMFFPEEVLDYTVYDALLPMYLSRAARDVWRDCRTIVDLDNALVRVMLDFEDCVHPIDIGYIQRFEQKVGPELQRVQNKLYQLAGGPFNLNSPKQLVAVLKNMGIDTGRTTDSGQMTTKEDALVPFRESHDFVDLLLQYRDMEKMHSTYIQAILNSYRADLGGCRFSYILNGAATGRMASGNEEQNPYFARMNVQNMPKARACHYLAVPGSKILGWDFIQLKRGEDGGWVTLDGQVVDRDIEGIVVEGLHPEGNFRRAFVPRAGDYFVHCDYAAEELRIPANLSGDSVMVDAFLSGKDLHRLTAEFLWGKENYNSDLRKKAKSVNFGMLYGGTKYLFAGILGCTPDEAQQYVDRWWSAYPGLKRWRREVESKGQSQGYVTTAFGRRRWVAHYFLRPQMAGYAKRTCINSPVQGTAADIIRRSLVRLHRSLLPKWGDRIQFLSVVHDEINFSVKKDCVEDVVRDMLDLMAVRIDRWPVPMVADFELGVSWGELYKFHLTEDGRLVPGEQ